MKRKSGRYGRGSVYQRKDGLWVGAAVVQGKRRYVYSRSGDEAEEKLAQLKAAARRGVPAASVRTTVGDCMDAWLEARRDSVRASTWQSYEGHVRLHLGGLRSVPLAALRPDHVRALIRDRLAVGCAPRTVAYTCTILRAVLKQAVRDELVSRNVALLVDLPSSKRPHIHILVGAELRRLLAVESQYGPLWTVLVGTGLRLGEALGLRSANVDLDAGLLRVTAALEPVPRHARPAAPRYARTGLRLQLVEPKTDAGRRTVALPNFVVQSLRTHLDRQESLPRNILGLLFTTPRGTPLDPRNVSRGFARDLVTAGLQPMRIHDLRHTAASLMLANGCSLDDVKRVLGHTSITVTSDTYGHLVEGRSREVAAAMDRAVG